VDSSYLVSPADIRHLAVKLLLPLLGQSSFLATSRPILKAFWSNIREDPSRTILRILTAVWKSINGQATSALNRKVSLALIDENAIDGIMKLYARDDNAEAIDGFTPADMAHHFLLRVCSSPGTAICFPDEGWYRRKGKGKALDGIDGDSQARDGQISRDDGSSRRSSDGIHNRILANVLRRIGPKVAEESKYAGLVEAILRACPELVAG
jgi:nucleolar pre-ribosomal-associated protein 1